MKYHRISAIEEGSQLIMSLPMDYLPILLKSIKPTETIPPRGTNGEVNTDKTQGQLFLAYLQRIDREGATDGMHLVVSGG